MEQPLSPNLNEIPTNASFVITAAISVWIEQESKRRGVSKSTVVREILESARTQAEREELAVPA